MRLLISSSLSAALLVCALDVRAAPPIDDPSTGEKPAANESSPRAKTSAKSQADYQRLRSKAIGEKFETLKARSKTYHKVVIKGIDDIGVRIMHEAGTARIPFLQLPPDLRKRFGYNPGAALKKKEEEKKTDAALARLTAEERKKLLEKRNARRLEAAREQEIAKTKQTVRSLQAKIRKLELGIRQAEVEISSLETRASRAAADAYDTVSRTDSRGVTQTYRKVNKGKLARAALYRKRADDERHKIKQAHGLIRSHKSEMGKLERKLRNRK